MHGVISYMDNDAIIPTGIMAQVNVTKFSKDGESSSSSSIFSPWCVILPLVVNKLSLVKAISRWYRSSWRSPGSNLISWAAVVRCNRSGGLTVNPLVVEFFLFFFSHFAPSIRNGAKLGSWERIYCKLVFQFSKVFIVSVFVKHYCFGARLAIFGFGYRVNDRRVSVF